MEHYEMTVQEDHKSERIDKYLTVMETDWSRTQVQQWIKEERVQVNDKAVKANYKVQPGDVVIVSFRLTAFVQTRAGRRCIKMNQRC